MLAVDSSDNRWREVGIDDLHPLRHLARRRIGELTVRVFDGPRSRFGAKLFRLHLENCKGAICEDLLTGLCGTGPHPSHNWIEIASACFEARFDGEAHLLNPETSECSRQLWQVLADAIPAGGHLMVEYESAEWRETADGLLRDLPPVATPLGHLMFRIGCGVNFKDWYFSEGLHEGPRKLQGWKALDRQHATKRAAEMEQELRTFLSTTPLAATELVARARARAEEIILRIEQMSAPKVTPAKAFGQTARSEVEADLKGA